LIFWTRESDDAKKILKWKISERKQCWPILNNYSNIFLEVHNKIMKSLKLTGGSPTVGRT
jgi:hypothetical protein